ncbi:MAG: hypothetical protein JWO89_2412 [Verrucomicrobiaceae bacterium]|nr:hypothetical protein [Verrucomicrobiaceae bacterium]MDB6117709.1 hypothetical protein [Verrucomicrobiaceae bacterium]
MNTTAVIPNTQLHLLKVAARCAVGFVWFYEGLVPKILHVSASQVCMVQTSGWWWGSPLATLNWLGVAMMVAGLVLMIGWFEKLAQFVATASVLVLIVLVIRNFPPALYDPFGGLAKDACLFTCSAVVWMLSGKTSG